MDAVKSAEGPAITTPFGKWAADGEKVLLEGPHSRLKELRLVLRVAWEFILGFRTLHFVGPCVTVFGSARFDVSGCSRRGATCFAHESLSETVRFRTGAPGLLSSSP